MYRLFLSIHSSCSFLHQHRQTITLDIKSLQISYINQYGLSTLVRRVGVMVIRLQGAEGTKRDNPSTHSLPQGCPNLSWRFPNL